MRGSALVRVAAVLAIAPFPDQHVSLGRLIAEGDFVAARATYSGTQPGPMGDFPATGRRAEAPFLAMFRIESGRIAELWVEWDNVAMLAQLGLFPPPVSDHDGSWAGRRRHRTTGSRSTWCAGWSAADRTTRHASRGAGSGGPARSGARDPRCAPVPGHCMTSENERSTQTATGRPLRTAGR